MINRYGIVCKGCDTPFTLRLAINVSNHLAFYVICPTCGLPITGKMTGHDLESFRMEIDAKVTKQNPIGPVATVDPFAPARIDADTMSGDFFGGLTNMNIFHICGNRAADYITTCNTAIDYLAKVWPIQRRALNYYTHGNAEYFAREMKKFAPIESSALGIGYSTEHERTTHAFNSIAYTSQVILPPGNEAVNFLGRLARKHTAALSNASYIQFLRIRKETGGLKNTQEHLFDELLRFIDEAEAWRTGIIWRYTRPDFDLRTTDWRLLRDEFSILRDLYLHGFEVICDCVDLIPAAQNTILRGNPDDFGDWNPVDRPNRTLNPPNSLAKFEKLNNADKLCFIRSIPGIDYLARLVDGPQRNTIGHSSARHDLRTGRITSSKDQTGISYLEFCAKVANLFEALALSAQIIRFSTIASSNDFGRHPK